VIGVVTSPTGAVIRDIMHRLNARFPRRVLLVARGRAGRESGRRNCRGHSRLQRAAGPGGRVPRPDVLIVARGGGSIEDLMAFNEEIVVRAAAESLIPLISAVGHETDTTLIDFVSDARAPTPTAAAEMAVPVRTDLIGQTLDLERRGLRSFVRALAEKRRTVEGLARALPRPDQLFAQPRQRFDLASERLRHALLRNLQGHRRRFVEASAHLGPQVLAVKIKGGKDGARVSAERLSQAYRTWLARERQRLNGLARLLDGVSYRAALERGFALVRGADGKLRRRAGSILAGETLVLAFADGEAEAAATSGGAAPAKPSRPRKSPGDQGSLL
jgi:exodeoxyribonuclease VII large subunit